jgi:hypothetical protein
MYLWWLSLPRLKPFFQDEGLGNIVFQCLKRNLPQFLSSEVFLSRYFLSIYPDHGGYVTFSTGNSSWLPSGWYFTIREFNAGIFSDVPSTM